MKPKGRFRYRPGQYILLKSEDLGRLQWHPFTLTSSPEEDHISVHIKCSGNWTGALYNAFAPGKQWPRLHVDGPFGAGQ